MGKEKIMDNKEDLNQIEQFNEEKNIETTLEQSTTENALEENKNNIMELEQNDETMIPQPITEDVVVENRNIEQKPKPNKGNKKGKKVFIWVLVVLIFIIAIVLGIFILNNENRKGESKEIKAETKQTDYRLSGNSLEPFDLYFLQLENEEVNKIYSPLSIKYALAMLNEGADGETKNQITNIIGDYQSKKYINSDNMSLANAMFIKDTFKNSIKEEYKTVLLNKYNAEVILDSFKTPDAINNWIKDKTLGLIDNLVDDVSDLDFALINALAIDMEWNQKFLHDRSGMVHYSHEKKKGTGYTYAWYSPEDVVSSKFKNVDEEISSMKIIASINNYDIVKEIGEDSIRKTVEDAYREHINTAINDCNNEYGGDVSQCWRLSNFDAKTTSEISNEIIENEVKSYLESYIESINKNYKDTSYNTEFSLYVDDEVKAFAKDLKEYNGTTLQYVGIMPVNENLNNYISKINAKSINNILSNLKELKSENFKEGVITEIKGYIPKFKFEYTLKLKEDLEKLGVKDIFDSSKANLTNLTLQKGTSIATVKHKANIEFTQEGIKASAATILGGMGAAGGAFDYLYEVPFEEIDLTFDKPYMFLIRDKETGEIWFTGTVYRPLLWNDDQTKGR